ncbi:hypothetical protein ILUMI_05307, partial [Ignelater luminosus]
MKTLLVLLTVISDIMLIFASVSHTPRLKYPRKQDPQPTSILKLNNNSNIPPLYADSEMQIHLHQHINQNISPCTNFYKYVCGSYALKNIPRDKESVNHFEDLSDEVTRMLHSLLDKPFKNRKWNEVQSFVNLQSLYKSCTNR